MFNISSNHKLANYTSWKIGGNAEYFFEPNNLAELQDFLKNNTYSPITIIGAGSNILVPDQGIKGLVIYLRRHLTQIKNLRDDLIEIEAGNSLFSLAQRGLAFLAGIPGTVGGALAMNAGAHGDCIWNYVVDVTTINSQGEITVKTPQEFIINYRQVTALNANSNNWFVSAKIQLPPNTPQDTEQKIKTYLQKRKDTQPLELPNCGSVFRNPPNDFAARLIESCGLKGKQIGGAKISEKHANFIVNTGGALAADVEKLIQEIILTVKHKHGVDLVLEVHKL